MDKPEQRFKVNTRVRLREGVDPSFFDGYSRVGNEGWIRRRKRDRYGYPEVLVEWDQDHWAYNGQPDCWTMEGQFEAVEGDMSERSEPNGSREEKVRDITEQFIRALFGTLGVEEETSVPEVSEKVNDTAQWGDLATEAIEAVQDAPGYLVIALEELEHEGAPPMIIPRVFYASRNAELRLIVQSQVAHVLAAMQDETIEETLQRGSDDGED